MAAKWIVHKGDTQLAPKDAYEIREGLRSGEIDPFDQVNLEGSPFLRTVIEVDEIFDTAEVVLEDVRGTVTPEPDVVPFEGKKTQEKKPELFLADPSIIQSPGKYTPSHQKKKKGLGGLADKFTKSKPSTVDFLPQKRQKSAANAGSRYRIIYASGKQSDLMSPEKIVATYKRGVLEKNVKVVKNGSSKKIEISKFVSTYDPSAVKAPRGKAASPGNASVSTGPSNLPKILLIIVGVLLVGGIGFVLANRMKATQEEENTVRFKQEPSSFRIGGTTRQQEVAEQPDRRRRVVKRSGFYSVKKAKASGKPVVTIGPMSYRVSALEQCGLKCELIFYDKEGGKIKVLFFTGKFKPMLENKASGLFVTGRFSPDGNSLFLQGVK